MLSGKKKQKLETCSQANQHYIVNKDRHTYSKTYSKCVRMCVGCQGENVSGGRGGRRGKQMKIEGPCPGQWKHISQGKWFSPALAPEFPSAKGYLKTSLRDSSRHVWAQSRFISKSFKSQNPYLDVLLSYSFQLPQHTGSQLCLSTDPRQTRVTTGSGFIPGLPVSNAKTLPSCNRSLKLLPVKPSHSGL